MKTFGKPYRRRTDDDQRVLPLINVVFLLLIFFMIAGQIAHTDPIKIEPPVSDSDTETGERELQILLAADGRIRLGGADVPLAALEERLRPLLSASRQKTVNLKSDGGADAVAVIGVLDRIKNAGAEKVKLLTTARPAP